MSCVRFQSQYYLEKYLVQLTKVIHMAVFVASLAKGNSRIENASTFCRHKCNNSNSKNFGTKIDDQQSVLEIKNDSVSVKL